MEATTERRLDLRGRLAALTDRIMTTVSDNGPGVATERREALFDPFVRGVPQTKHFALGLGLPACRMIAELYTGEAFFEDPSPQAPQGATLQIVPPLALCA